MLDLLLADVTAGPLAEVCILECPLVYCVITYSYIIKEKEKLVLCRCGVIMHSGNVKRILKTKYSATPRVLKYGKFVGKLNLKKYCLPMRKLKIDEKVENW